MNIRNPFEVLYMGEEIDPVSFVQIFSPLLVHDTLALFRSGNSVLMGTQGSGKSMLLTLLKPETRRSFAEAKVPFVVPPEIEFVGAGINLTRSGATDFGQRAVEDVEHGEWETYFGDFVNYWTVRDVIRSIGMLQRLPAGSTPVNASQGDLDLFADKLASQPVWLDALGGVRGTGDLLAALDRRLRDYRAFLNFNSETLPDYIRTSKTEPGEPLSIAADLMRDLGLVSPSTNLLIRIDQYEVLARESGMSDRFDFRSVVHKMMSSRDPRVSYKLGTRRHAWPTVPRVHGGAGRLEALRNFKLIDLDDLLRTEEHGSGQFPKFAEDVFQRRLQWAGYARPTSGRDPIKQVFGPTDPPHEAAAKALGAVLNREKLLERDSATTLSDYVQLLWELDPLSAQLGEAWILQKGDSEREPGQDEPWGSRRKPWWYKERVPLALTQLSASRRQRLVYAGSKDVVQLSGANILAFISICQFIWDSWLRESEEAGAPSSLSLPRIDSRYAQDEGIRQASSYWFEKIRSDPDGDQRQRFVRFLGTNIRDWLRSDRRMSNPGFNGFSLDIDELEADDVVRDFLGAAAAYGVLVDRKHTSKNRPGGPRVAWYLNAIYGPYFQIPVARQKEPRYVRTSEVRQWMVSSKILPPDTIVTSSEQGRLF